MSKPICFTLIDDHGDETEHKLPSCWDICPRCSGNGTHDHPVFSNGLSQEDFDEDPDFKDAYMRGEYDVVCGECNGSGKVLVPNEDAMNSAERVLFEKYVEARAEDARERRADAYTRYMESGGAS